MALLRDLSELLFSFQKEHSSSVKARLHLIDTLHTKVMVHYFAKQERSQGEPDFGEHLKELQVNLEELSGRWKAAVPQDDPERYSYFMEVLERAVGPFKGQCTSKGATAWETVELMADLEYHPTLAQLSVLLYTLWCYWDGFRDYMDDPKDDFEAALDLNLAKLAYHVGVETSSILHWGEKKEAVARLNLNKKIRAMAQAEDILSAFRTVRKEPNDTLNRIVGRIHTSLHKDDLSKKLSKKTIERTLKSNQQLMNECFHKEVRGNKSRFLYIRQTGV